MTDLESTQAHQAEYETMVQALRRIAICDQDFGKLLKQPELIEVVKGLARDAIPKHRAMSREEYQAQADADHDNQARPTCQLCGEPMPPGEEMFNYHGYGGPCPQTQGVAP